MLANVCSGLQIKECVVRNVSIAIVLLLSSVAAAAAQTPPPAPAPASQATAPATAPPTELQKKIEAYLRDLYGFGKDFTITLSAPQPTPISDLSVYNVEVAFNGQSDTTVIYVSKDGKFLIRGELDDMSIDPLESVRKLIHTQGAPEKGPSDSRVTVVEYADYECPSCLQFDTLWRTFQAKYPQVRYVFKDFPLTDLHPWAMSAAEAAHCVYTQSPSFFWKFHDSIYDAQDLFSPDNAFDKLVDLATQAGANPEQLKTCMADSHTADFIQAEQTEGQSLDISSTPTIFVNGRRIVGPNQELLEQYIQFELAKKSQPPKTP
jgi:protein-disulfide isomerase